MNCNNARKYLLAFADGQLSVQTNCEVLDHLKMCPACSAVVDGHHSLRRSIAKSAGKIAVPAGLDAKVRHHIEVDGIGKAHKVSTQVRTFRFARTLAAAACVIIVALISWQFTPMGNSTGGSGFGTGSVAGLSKADEVTQQVVIQHNKCMIKCEHQAHQLDSMSHERVTVLASAAPDLSGYGYDFESANVCVPSSDVDGAAAHLMYVNPSNGTYLSLFATPHWSGINVFAGERSPDRNDPFTHSTRDCESNSMVAWHEGNTTLILVGKFDEEQMSANIRDLKLAEGGAFNSDALAAIVRGN